MKAWQNIVGLTAAACVAALVFGFFLFASYTTRTDHSSDSRAHAIVALTGGGHRLSVAGGLLKAGQAKRLLITGVNRIVKPIRVRKLLQIDDALFKCCVDIDYVAQNTRGNAQETRKWINKHGFESLIVVTSSYHMPRSLTEIARLVPSVDLIAHPVVPSRLRQAPWWLDRGNIRLLVAEYLKFLPSATQFTVGRMVATPNRSRQADLHKAVAIQ